MVRLHSIQHSASSPSAPVFPSRRSGRSGPCPQSLHNRLPVDCLAHGDAIRSAIQFYASESTGSSPPRAPSAHDFGNIVGREVGEDRDGLAMRGGLGWKRAGRIENRARFPSAPVPGEAGGEQPNGPKFSESSREIEELLRDKHENKLESIVSDGRLEMSEALEPA